ncbi:hypothetical protein E2C01_034282 [Portunus trituberculatus]|uniref:Uncharacterized protein n=1 Tax=Portunus trituberculatus TaxID=210409 RepID=A0A5B7F5B9_PORTR|nr:hypothetical protein [Portunus trituberculatus]
MEAILLQPVFRNTIHGFYITLHEDFTGKIKRSLLRSKSNATKPETQSVMSQEMFVHRRCLYCEGGEAGVLFVGKLHTKAERESHEEYLPLLRGAE